MCPSVVFNWWPFGAIVVNIWGVGFLVQWADDDAAVNTGSTRFTRIIQKVVFYSTGQVFDQFDRIVRSLANKPEILERENRDAICTGISHHLVNDF